MIEIQTCQSGNIVLLVIDTMRDRELHKDGHIVTLDNRSMYSRYWQLQDVVIMQLVPYSGNTMPPIYADFLTWGDWKIVVYENGNSIDTVLEYAIFQEWAAQQGFAGWDTNRSSYGNNAIRDKMNNYHVQIQDDTCNWDIYYAGPHSHTVEQSLYMFERHKYNHSALAEETQACNGCISPDLMHHATLDGQNMVHHILRVFSEHYAKEMQSIYQGKPPNAAHIVPPHQPVSWVKRKLHEWNNSRSCRIVLLQDMLYAPRLPLFEASVIAPETDNPSFWQALWHVCALAWVWLAGICRWSSVWMYRNMTWVNQQIPAFTAASRMQQQLQRVTLCMRSMPLFDKSKVMFYMYVPPLIVAVSDNACRSCINWRICDEHVAAFPPGSTCDIELLHNTLVAYNKIGFREMRLADGACIECCEIDGVSWVNASTRRYFD